MPKKITVTKGIKEETAFDRTKLISWWSQDIVSSSKILVVGAGAIGNETLKNLALMGAGNIFICDMDTVSVSNLSRTVLFDLQDVGKYKAEVAAQKVLAMSNNPDCNVDYFVGDIIHGLGHGVFRRFDVVLGCLDNMLTRADANRRACLFKKPYLDAGISELTLALSVHHYPYSSCYRCGVDDMALASERMERYSCDVFKKRAIQERHAATVLISTAIVSALQVQEAIKILHHLNGVELESPVQYGKAYHFEGANNTFTRLGIPFKEECTAHFSIDEVIETPLSSRDKLGFVLSELKGMLGYDCVIDTYPDESFVTQANCIKCHKPIAVNRPASEIYSDELYCNNCKTEGTHNEPSSGFNAIDLFFAGMPEQYLMDYTLEQVGIPPLHVITVREKGNDDNVKYIELTGDLHRVLPNTFGK